MTGGWEISAFQLCPKLRFQLQRTRLLGVKWWKQRVGVRMLRVELGHPRAALGRPPKLFGDGTLLLRPYDTAVPRPAQRIIKR